MTVAAPTLKADPIDPLALRYQNNTGNTYGDLELTFPAGTMVTGALAFWAPPGNPVAITDATDISSTNTTVTMDWSGGIPPDAIVTVAVYFNGPSANPTSVDWTPEPGTLGLLATGLLAMALVMRKRNAGGIRRAT
jgi:hypothetical protein